MSSRNRIASALVVTPNDCNTSETLWRRSGGDWEIKRAGRKQEARGIGQSARLNTAQPYARRRGGPGQAVFVGAGIVQCMPIRLLPSFATARVSPFARIKCGIGWCHDISCDPKQGAARVEWVEPAVESNREFIEVGL